MKKHLLLAILMLLPLLASGQTKRTINVETAGTLPTLISDEEKYTIEELTLTGELNGTDFRLLRDMAGNNYLGNLTNGKLKVLDLSGTVVKSGGLKYLETNIVRITNNSNFSGNFYYEVEAGKMPKQVFFGCKLEKLSIPSGITVIDDDTFLHCKSLKTITIHDGVTKLGNYAFGWCEGLMDIVIPESVTSFFGYTFYGCKSLKTIQLPKSLSSFFGGAFYDCTNLEAILVHPENESFTSLDGVVFTKDMTSLFVYPPAKAGDYVIPTQVTTIASYAFYACYNLTSVKLPESLTTISQSAFELCKSLQSVSIPSTVNSIDSYAFKSCSELNSIIVDNGNAIYDSRDNCNAIIETAANQLLFGCKNTIIPNTVTSIANYAFNGCTTLTSITIPSSVSKIGESAFAFCKNLKSLILSENITSIENWTFWACEVLETIDIPDKVKTIGKYAFSSCYALTSVTIPKGVVSIGTYAFGSCSNLESVTCLPEEVPAADYNSFDTEVLNKCILQVPIFSLNSYKAQVPWSNFKEIKAIEDPDEFSLNFMGQTINDGATLLINAEGWSGLGSIYTDAGDNTKNGLFIFISKGGKISGNYSLEIISNTLNGDLKWSIGGETYALNEVTKLEKTFSTDENGIASVKFSAENIPSEGSLTARLTVTIGEKTKTFNLKVDFKKKESPDLTVSGKVGEPVDLGLSVKWASWNVGAGAPEEYGNHYAWGELEPKTDYSASTYKFYSNGYTKYGSVDKKYELDEADDVARQKWGKDWRMPTINELKELYEKCSFTRETINGVPVTKVTGPNGNYIYMPGSGNFTGQTLYFKDDVGSYWSRNLENDSYANDLDFFTGSRSLNGDTRYHGQSVRPVYAKIVSGKAGEPVDLGLTSGTLWSSCNIGASTPEEYGSYFAWGETAPKSNYDWSTYKFGGGSNFTKYNSSDGLTELALEDDAAYVLWGENWRMPTHQQELELVNECTRESVTLNGISGYKFTGPNGNSIFMPRGGLYDGTDYDADGTKVSYANTRGWYWSSTLNAIGSPYAQGLCFFPSLLSNVSDHERCDGHNIRPVYVCGLSKRIVHVAEAGSLPTLISDAEKYLIHELVLTGEINGTDWRLIRDMAGCNYQGKLTNGNLEILDLSGVRIVPGGLNYLDADDGLPNLGGRFHYAIVNADELSQYILHGCNRLVSILLPKSLKTICYGAFNCRNLRNVTIPNGVNSIGFYAFRGCRSLPSITIPASVSSIGNYTFDHCISLTSILVDADNQYFTSIDGVLFNKDVTVIRRYPEGKTENSYTLPETITTLAESSFNNCVNLIDIKFPKNLKTIEPWAFGSCTGLKSFVIPDEVETVGVYAFWDCDNLESIVIPAQMKQIDICAFQSCDKLKSVISYMPDPIAMGVYDPWSKEYATVESVFDSEAFNTAILTVPYGKTEVYKSAEGWNNFKNVVEMGETTPIIISSAKQVTYMSDKNLDFTGYPDLKAYVATGYDKSSGTIWLTRVKEVPANTGFLLMGEANTYEIPAKSGESTSYYMNLFKGTIEGTTIYTTDGDYTNYYLSNGDAGVGFYKVTKTEGVALAANRAYLSVPTEIPTVGSEGSTETIKVSAAGQVPYYNSQSLDFTSLDAQGVKAYTATGYDYNSGTIWLTRVKQVPAETGILIMAPEGEYPVPTASVASVYANMFRGTLEGKTIQTHEEIDGKDYINYYLSSGASGVGFYRVTNEEGVKIGTNRCYLPILNKDAAAGTRSANSDLNQIAFEEADEVIGIQLLRGIGGDEDGTTAVKEVKSGEVKGEEWYTLQGQRVAKPGKGLYIRNGKVVVIK